MATEIGGPESSQEVDVLVVHRRSTNGGGVAQRGNEVWPLTVNKIELCGGSLKSTITLKVFLRELFHIQQMGLVIRGVIASHTEAQFSGRSAL